MLAGSLAPGAARAHPLAAEPPVFGDFSCILTIDKTATPRPHFSYGVSFDDHELRPGDADLPDQRTHQFFAVQGYVAVSGGDVVFARLDDPAGALVRLPHWMSRAELQRAANALPAEYSNELAVDRVEPFDILEGNANVEPWLRVITASAARVPITAAGAAAGFDWDLAAVPVGVYQIVGYIFSPPYNGWAARPGMVRVIERGEGPPALTVERVAAQLFAGQGRRLRGCVAAAPGTILRIGWRPANAPDAEFEPAAPALEVATGEFEACLENSGRDAVMEVRLELQDESGQVWYHRPLEALTLFSRAISCEESEIHCCPAGAADAGPADLGMAVMGTAAEDPDTGAPPPVDRARDPDGGLGGSMARAASSPARPASHMTASPGCRCQALLPRSEGTRAGSLGWLGGLGLSSWFIWGRRRCRRG